MRFKQKLGNPLHHSLLSTKPEHFKQRNKDEIYFLGLSLQLPFYSFKTATSKCIFIIKFLIFDRSHNEEKK